MYCAGYGILKNLLPLLHKGTHIYPQIALIITPTQNAQTQSYSIQAKRALATVLPQSKISIMELDNRDDGNAIQDVLLDLTGARSVPRVFIDGEFIGGGDDTAALASSGKLAIMLKDKGIA